MLASVIPIIECSQSDWVTAAEVELGGSNTLAKLQTIEWITLLRTRVSPHLSLTVFFLLSKLSVLIIPHILFQVLKVFQVHVCLCTSAEATGLSSMWMTEKWRGPCFISCVAGTEFFIIYLCTFKINIIRVISKLFWIIVTKLLTATLHFISTWIWWTAKGNTKESDVNI